MRAERDCRDYVCTLQRNAKQRSAVSELEARQAGRRAGKQASKQARCFCNPERNDDAGQG